MDILLERIIECIGPRHGAKKELAEHLGIHPNVITNWLNGRNKSYRRYVNEIAAFTVFLLIIFRECRFKRKTARLSK